MMNVAAGSNKPRAEFLPAADRRLAGSVPVVAWLL